MAQLKWIEFYTENCEIFKIDGRYVGDLLCDNFKTRIRRTAANSIDKITTVEEFAVELFAGGNKPTTYGEYSFAETVYDRLHYYNDITEVTLYFDGGECYSFCPTWEDATANGEENALQTSYITSSGNLYVTISLMPFQNYFDKEEINDEEYMKIKAEFYDIGSEVKDD